MTLAIALTSSTPLPAIPAIEALVLSAKSGQPEALDSLLRAIEQRLYLFCCRVLADSHQAEDATQESLFLICRHISSYREGTNFWAWAHKISLRQCQTLRRKHRPAEALPSTHPAITPAPERAQQFQHVLSALTALSEKERSALVLTEIEGYTSNEAARILHCLPMTVRSRASAARRKVREALSNHYPELREQA